MEKSNIELKLTIEETNIILDALGNEPFRKVFNLIGKIQQQASEQLSENNGTNLKNTSLNIDDSNG